METPDRTRAWLLPGWALLREYKREWLRGDLLSGFTVAVVMIPSVMAYAGLMGLRPQHGLYAALVPLILYPLFGSSRQVIVGPDIAISILVASAITPLAGGDPAQAVALASSVALMSGVLLVLGARFHIGAVAEFLSKPVLIGYMTGAALILMASQLDQLFGIPLKNHDFFPRLGELSGKLSQTHRPTLYLGLALLGVIFISRRVSHRVPAALVVFVIAIPASLILGLDAYGVRMVGAFPHELPAFRLPKVDWHDIHTLLPAAAGIALLTYTEGILLARAFASKHGYDVNPNQELTALGAADLGAGFFQGFPITGSQARTTINDATGAKSQLSSLVAAVVLVLFLLFLAPLMANLPMVALAAILIFGGFTLVEFDSMIRLYRWYPGSSLLSAVTTIGVLAVGVVPGILVGVALSLLGLINRLSHPPDAVLREVPGHGYHDLGQAPEVGRTIPGLVAYRYYAPLLFSNATHFVVRVRQVLAASPTPVRWLLLDAQAITDIDVTAAEALHGLHEELKGRGVALKVAHANRPFREILRRIGLADELGEASFFNSVHECVEAFDGEKKG